MKPAVLGVIGLLVGLGGSSGLVAFRSHGKAPATTEQETAVDTLAASQQDSVMAPIDSAPRPVPDSASMEPAAPGARDTASPLAPAAPQAVAPTDSVAPPRPPLDTAAYRQLAKIFTNMKPSDAVRIMGYLSDNDVEQVLRRVQPKASAELMAAMSAERAATIGKRLIAGTGK
jgi:predicted component of type VI protein secretion system